MPEINPAEFTHPRMLFAERQTVNNATGAMDQNEFKVSRDTIVDWIVVSEETFSGGAGAPSASFLRFIDINWNVNARSNYYPQPYVPAPSIMNFYDADRTSNPVGAANTVSAPFLWKHPVPWMYNVGQDVHIDWINPVANVPTVATLPSLFGFHGVGEKTGHRRIFTFPFTIAVGAVTPVQGSGQLPQTTSNVGSEPYFIESTFWGANSANWDAGDARWLNHMRYKTIPTEGEAWSDIAVPILFYGVHQGMANRAAWHKPAGGSIFLHAGDAINFYFRNNGSGVTTNIQIAVLGRTLPGYRGVL